VRGRRSHSFDRRAAPGGYALRAALPKRVKARIVRAMTSEPHILPAAAPCLRLPLGLRLLLSRL
jgi:hypothetical protein